MKKLLAIVDMINGFAKYGALSNPKSERIIAENVKLIKEFISNDDYIVAFTDAHANECMEFNIFPPHCVIGSGEEELVDELKEYIDEMTVIHKNNNDGMLTEEFMRYIQEHKDIEEIVVTGLCTDICVMYTAISILCYMNEYNRKVNVIVPKNAVDTYHADGIHDQEEWSNMAFRFMTQAGIKVVYTI